MMLLEVVKAAETRDAVYLVLKDDDAKKVAVAWTLLHPKFEDVKTPLRAPSGCYTLAWDRAPQLDWSRLASLSGISLYDTQEAFSRLKSAMLVYPDGSVHQVLMSIIRAEIGAHIRGIIPSRAEPRPEPPKLPAKKRRR